MRTTKVWFVAALALVLLFSACAPTATPETPTATLIPATATDTAVPTLAPVNLGGPSAGTTVQWMDGGSLVYVPAGQFTMGSGIGDAPTHGVSLSAYWIQRTKVTNRMYALCVGVGVCKPPKQTPGAAVYTDPAFADHPVVGVDWEQANTYCGWIGGRLPTEAEWEQAARGPGSQNFPWGNDQPTCNRLNYNYCESATTSVVAYPDSASPYGALDMAGNVFEWTWDWYSETYYATSPIQDPPGPADGLYKSIRGSSFESEPGQIPSATRHFVSPAVARRDTGFRCVVQQPINFPPYCQASAYQAAPAAPSSQTCGGPQITQYNPYCTGNTGYSSLDVPLGTQYRVETPGFSCIETNTNGILRLNCTGPDSSTGQLTVCNPACGDPTSSPNQSAVCDPGYTYDPATRQCLYTPLVGQSGPQGCPPGYALDSTGQVCRPSLGPDNQCPLGQYFDSLFGGCVPTNGQANCNVYGLDNSSLAQGCYPGCPAGFSYDSAAQCCAAPAAGLYPTCQPGFTYDPTFGGCVPGLASVSGAGCTTVNLEILQCGPLYDCGKFTTETSCIRNQVYGCYWDDKINACLNKK